MKSKRERNLWATLFGGIAILIIVFQLKWIDEQLNGMWDGEGTSAHMIPRESVLVPAGGSVTHIQEKGGCRADNHRAFPGIEKKKPNTWSVVFSSSRDEDTTISVWNFQPLRGLSCEESREQLLAEERFSLE